VIFLKLGSANLPATMSNKLSHVAVGLVDYLIKRHERKEISRLELVCQVGQR